MDLNETPFSETDLSNGKTEFELYSQNIYHCKERVVIVSYLFSRPNYFSLKMKAIMLSYNECFFAIKLRKTITICLSCFRSMNYEILRFRMISISYLFMFALLPFSATIAHAECISETRLDVSVELILSSIQNASDIDHISELIKQINTEIPLFCEQEKIKSSGLVSNISVLKFFEKEIVIYQIAGKWAVLTLNFDYKSGKFLPEYSGIRTKKTVGDYQLVPLKRQK